MSASLPGLLMELGVKDGDAVEQGQILAVIDNRVATAAVNSARAAAGRTAEIEHAKRGLELAESLYARHLALDSADAGVEFELEQARVRRDQAKATLTSAIENQLQAKRNLELEEARLEAHNIRAPFRGRILKIRPSVGTSLAASDELLTIVCMDSLQAELYLPLELFGKLEVGKSYQLLASEPVNRPLHARLRSADSVIDAPSRTFRCVFVIDNQDHQLPAGFGARFDEAQFHSLQEDAR